MIAFSRSSTPSAHLSRAISSSPYFRINSSAVADPSGVDPGYLSAAAVT